MCKVYPCHSSKISPMLAWERCFERASTLPFHCGLLVATTGRHFSRAFQMVFLMSYVYCFERSDVMTPTIRISIFAYFLCSFTELQTFKPNHLL